MKSTLKDMAVLCLVVFMLVQGCRIGQEQMAVKNTLDGVETLDETNTNTDAYPWMRETR